MAEKKEKKEKGRRAYLNDFVATPNGDYVYTGKVYRWESDRKSVLLRLWGLSGGMVICAVAAGCIPGTGMEGAVWALLPYVVALIAAFTCLYAVGRLSMAGSEVRAYVYRGSVEALPRRCVVAAIAAGVALLGELVNLVLLKAAGSIFNALLLLVLEGLILAGAILLRRCIMDTEWKLKQ